MLKNKGLRTVIPYDTHSPTKLLNYLNSPDCVIFTAGMTPSTLQLPFPFKEKLMILSYSTVIASAAVPGIINPVVLLTKDKQGKLHPYVSLTMSADCPRLELTS